ncbi:hypothetical protein Cgig2_013879 [Carnegiea gigantea]|uniref:DUF4283 domain-containing protein n=1 Tax=Carnegiea gigantea TaxID=171969 RepID=A0A9Q1GPJ6_9CARY|nr:hypothetical protein Cgig2_013879 [Carnegiea gigantea]
MAVRVGEGAGFRLSLTDLAESPSSEQNDDDTPPPSPQATPSLALKYGPLVHGGAIAKQWAISPVVPRFLIWGDLIPIPAIIHKTKKDWYFVKGQVDYIDASNDWLMLRFTTVEDRILVFDQRPWHVNGLNFVVKKWTPFFDSYTASFDRIDQWVRVLRLPWEFWGQTSLTELLKPVGTMVRVDQNTHLSLKGKFAHVCLNIHITHPLPGSLTIARDEGSPNDDNLVAMVAGADEGMDEEENVDMFLNLENIKDVEMSIESSKRKRVKEGEECTSHS